MGYRICLQQVRKAVGPCGKWDVEIGNEDDHEPTMTSAVIQQDRRPQPLTRQQLPTSLNDRDPILDQIRTDVAPTGPVSGQAAIEQLPLGRGGRRPPQVTQWPQWPQFWNVFVPLAEPNPLLHPSRWEGRLDKTLPEEDQTLVPHISYSDSSKPVMQATMAGNEIPKLRKTDSGYYSVLSTQVGPGHMTELGTPRTRLAISKARLLSEVAALSRDQGGNVSSCAPRDTDSRTTDWLALPLNSFNMGEISIPGLQDEFGLSRSSTRTDTSHIGSLQMQDTPTVDDNEPEREDRIDSRF
ncbi:hypothetical protein GQ44DRAFT_177544 [Phaeosphaeriaceae sp. PMI808]|nr:hypothetical protein GQ44DRAFT_177544 [Phaeosphaeriaceae sp. PMI808]